MNAMTDLCHSGCGHSFFVDPAWCPYCPDLEVSTAFSLCSIHRIPSHGNQNIRARHTNRPCLGRKPEPARGTCIKCKQCLSLWGTAAAWHLVHTWLVSCTPSATKTLPAVLLKSQPSRKGHEKGCSSNAFCLLLFCLGFLFWSSKTLLHWRLMWQL